MISAKAVRRWPTVLGGFTLLTSILWCVFLWRTIYYTGDYMIGFAPWLLFLPALVVCLAVLLLLALALRHWPFVAMAAVALFLPIFLFSQAWRIEPWAWEKSIGDHDLANRDAIARASDLPDSDDAQPGALWRTEDLPVLGGFQWYCKHHLASPDDQFRAFRYRSVVHVRIQKVHGGYRGIAFISDQTQRDSLKESPSFEYERTANDHWLVWSTR